MSTTRPAIMRLHKILQLMKSAEESIHIARDGIQHEYEMLGIMHHDSHSKKLENVIERCCDAMSAAENELDCGEEFLSQLINMIEEYENVQF